MDSRAIRDVFFFAIYITNTLNVSDLFQRNAKYDLYGCCYITESLSWGIFSEYNAIYQILIILRL